LSKAGLSTDSSATDVSSKARFVNKYRESYPMT
jgi:hypothetical protein